MLKTRSNYFNLSRGHFIRKPRLSIRMLDFAKDFCFRNIRIIEIWVLFVLFLYVSLIEKCSNLKHLSWCYFIQVYKSRSQLPIRIVKQLSVPCIYAAVTNFMKTFLKSFNTVIQRVRNISKSYQRLFEKAFRCSRMYKKVFGCRRIYDVQLFQFLVITRRRVSLLD